MADRLRAGDGDGLGLVTANGGYLTKHAMGVYGTEPPAAGVFRHAEPQAEVDARPSREADDDPAGAATVEAYTVTHARTGEPERAVFALTMPDGRRAWGTSVEPATLADLEREEAVGRSVHVEHGGDTKLI
jgi:acetyl-CoA C-acetyltransferase